MDRKAPRNNRGDRRDDPRAHNTNKGMLQHLQRPEQHADYLIERERSRSPRKERPNERRRDRSPIANGRVKVEKGGRAQDRSGKGGATQSNDRESNGTRATRISEPVSRQSHSKPTSRPTGRREIKPEVDVKMEEPPEDEDEEAAMQRMMGFRDFRTTKNTKVPGNDRNYAVSKVKKAEYRQYMNRVGGFNRPLSPGKG